VFSKRFWAVFVNLADILLLIEVKLTAFFLQSKQAFFSFFFVHRANIKKISNLSQRFFYPKTVRASFDTAYFARAGPIITQTAILAMVPTSQLTPTL